MCESLGGIDRNPSPIWRDAVSQGKIVPLIAASVAKERALVDERLAVLAADVREISRRLDEITSELSGYASALREDRGGG